MLKPAYHSQIDIKITEEFAKTYNCALQKWTEIYYLKCISKNRNALRFS